MNINDLSALPMNAMKEIPQPGPDAKRIVGIVKERGRISGYKLSDGTMLNKQQGIALARHGGIQGVGISTNKGSEYLKSLPDQTEGNNLSNLPVIKQ